MEIDAALTTYLLTRSGLTALIGQRIYPEETPQTVDLKTQAAVVYLFVDDIKDHTHDGISNLESPNIQFTAYAPTRAGARAVSLQLKSSLSDFVGTLSGLQIQWIKLVNELPGKETSADGTIKVHTVDLEFEVNFIRS
jgi:hypothetical protein